MSNQLTTTTIKLPSKFSHAAITGTWDGARRWSNDAATCERLKLFCQVMTGFELIALKATNGHTHGGARVSSGNDCHLNPSDQPDQSDKLTWEERVEQELGQSRRTAHNWELMARACATKLKRLPALKDFDPFSTNLAELPAPKLEALQTAVKKLTDGQTQKEFGESLGLWKKPAGANSGRKSGDGGRPPSPTSPDEVRAARIKMAREDVDAALKSLSALDSKWLALSEKEDEMALCSLLHATRNQAKALELWLSAPPAKRDADLAAKIEKLLK